MSSERNRYNLKEPTSRRFSRVNLGRDGRVNEASEVPEIGSIISYRVSYRLRAWPKTWQLIRLGA
jgi:hypothetical protein